MRIAFHGITKENSKAILKKGFIKGTYFAKHLEDALEFGGTWVFNVRFPDSIDSQGWQFRIWRRVSPKRIVRLTQYQPIVWRGKQPCLTRKEKVVYAKSVIRK